MPNLMVNYGAVVVCAVINMALGFLWYGSLFQKPWTKMMGIDCSDEHKMKAMQKKAMPAHIVSFITSLVMAYILTHFIRYAGVKTAMDGAAMGFWAWLGFVLPPTLAGNMYGGKKIQLWFIDGGYYLVSLLIFGAVVASWV